MYFLVGFRALVCVLMFITFQVVFTRMERSTLLGRNSRLYWDGARSPLLGLAECKNWEIVITGNLKSSVYQYRGTVLWETLWV